MNQTLTYKIGQRVQVVNLQPDGTPGAYHACTAHIVRLFDHDGQPAARVEFVNGVQKNLMLDKLAPMEKPARPVERTTRNAPLPSWARPDCRWVLGSELCAGDTVYFAEHANPRQLVERVGQGWLGAVIISYYGMERRINGQPITITPARWYVVKGV